MYRPKAFAVDDLPTLHAFIRARSFATLAASVNDSLHFAYAPVVLDADRGGKGTVRFHLARGNPLAAVAGRTVHFSFLGPDAYVSPDWYVTEGLVPTWNYIAVEGSGIANTLDDGGLRRMIDDLSASQEAHLLPKTPWTTDKLTADRLDGLMRAIVGFEVTFDALEGKFKLSQDKRDEDAQGVAAHLEQSPRAGDRETGLAMRSARPG